jgi:hypothetical protein
MISKVTFLNQAAFAKDPSESKFQAKQVSLPTFTKHDFGITRGLVLSDYKVQALSEKSLVEGL